MLEFIIFIAVIVIAVHLIKKQIKKARENAQIRLVQEKTRLKKEKEEAQKKALENACQNLDTEFITNYLNENLEDIASDFKRYVENFNDMVWYLSDIVNSNFSADYLLVCADGLKANYDVRYGFMGWDGIRRYDNIIINIMRGATGHSVYASDYEEGDRLCAKATELKSLIETNINTSHENYKAKQSTIEDIFKRVDNFIVEIENRNSDLSIKSSERMSFELVFGTIEGLVNLMGQSSQTPSMIRYAAEKHSDTLQKSAAGVPGFIEIKKDDLRDLIARWFGANVKIE
ncbi:MAG: hypothetical protein FWG64_02980 [Firmicutes bacterium]|nr:hypothetical protein [Bacillota bacterium]